MWHVIALWITKMAITRGVKILVAIELWNIWLMECIGVEMWGSSYCKDVLFMIELILCVFFFLFRISGMFINTCLWLWMCGRPLEWWWQCCGLLGLWSMRIYRGWFWVPYQYHLWGFGTYGCLSKPSGILPIEYGCLTLTVWQAVVANNDPVLPVHKHPVCHIYSLVRLTSFHCHLLP